MTFDMHLLTLKGTTLFSAFGSTTVHLITWPLFFQKEKQCWSQSSFPGTNSSINTGYCLNHPGWPLSTPSSSYLRDHPASHYTSSALVRPCNYPQILHLTFWFPLIYYLPPSLSPNWLQPGTVTFRLLVQVHDPPHPPH